MFLTDFRYEGTTSGTVGLGTDFPSKIIRFNLDDFDNNTLICQRGAYLASNPHVNIEMEFTKSLTTGFFGGEGFVLQRLSGQGDVLVKGGGTIICKVLEEGEALRVTSGSIVCFEPTVQYNVQMMPGEYVSTCVDLGSWKKAEADRFCLLVYIIFQESRMSCSVAKVYSLLPSPAREGSGCKACQRIE